MNFRRLVLNLCLLTTVSCAYFSCFNSYKSNNQKLYQPPFSQQVKQTFKYKGRFVILSGYQSYYGNFIWIKNKDYQQLELNSILGSTIAKIIISDSKYILQLKNKIYTQHLNKEHNFDLAKYYLGFDLPLQYIYYWIQGFPLPQYHSQLLTNGFTQQGWQIEYLQYKADTPTVIKLIDHKKLVIKIFNQTSNIK